MPTLYGRKWQKARKIFLLENPFCIHCARLGKTLQSIIVDHVQPHKGDLKLFWLRSNWQALCKPCHDRKTARYDSGFARTNKPDGACDIEGMPVDPTHHWN